MQEAILRWPAVTEISGLSRSTIWRLERDGKFPKRRQLGPKSVGWLKSEIEAWITTRKMV